SRMACRQPANQQWNHHNSAHDLEYPSNVALKRHAPVVVFSGLPCPRKLGNYSERRAWTLFSEVAFGATAIRGRLRGSAKRWIVRANLWLALGVTLCPSLARR